MLYMYGLGLGAISMEPHEQKHQVLARYSENTTPQDRWNMIMTHDYMASIYIRENGFDECKYEKSKHRYLPALHDTKCSNCGLTKSDSGCRLCTDMLLNVVKHVDKPARSGRKSKLSMTDTAVKPKRRTTKL